MQSYLLDMFGRPPRQITCECERTTQPNIAQALHLLNGDFLNKKIADADGPDRDAAQGEEAAAGDRRGAVPGDAVAAAAAGRAGRGRRAGSREAPTPREGVQDLLWVLLNSREFLFNH